MTMRSLGRLERVGLREVWRNEANDFTPWLAEEANLQLLAEAIGLELELERQEKEVGPFSADLLCKNTLDDSWVVIENQIAKTDHVHLGQIMTYAAGLEAVTVVWVAERFTEEHRAALDWLNEITHDRFAFFGLEIEVWRISDSLPAPKFNVVCKPNEWSQEIQSSVQSGSLSEAKQLQLRYWTAFRDFMAKSSKVRCQKPYPGSWMNHSVGLSGAHVASVASLWDSEKNAMGSENRVELYLDGPRAKELFGYLADEKDEVEHEMGQPLVWHNPENAKSCRIYIRTSADIKDESKWHEQFEWLRKNVESFIEVFRPRLKKLTDQS